MVWHIKRSAYIHNCNAKHSYCNTSTRFVIWEKQWKEYHVLGEHFKEEGCQERKLKILFWMMPKLKSLKKGKKLFLDAVAVCLEHWYQRLTWKLVKQQIWESLSLSFCLHATPRQMFNTSMRSKQLSQSDFSLSSCFFFLKDFWYLKG